jgi:single-strand DNA-binding protein
MNKVILMGRLTKDPELRNTQQGTMVCSFSMAVNRRFVKEGQQNADFINCTAWRNTAEFVSKYFSKGNMIAVVGSLQTRTWEGQDGKKQYAMDVVVDEAYFTGSKESTSPSPSAMPSEFEGFTVADAIDNTNLPWG